jgi:hypothetical protein
MYSRKIILRDGGAPKITAKAIAQGGIRKVTTTLKPTPKRNPIEAFLRFTNGP